MRLIVVLRERFVNRIGIKCCAINELAILVAYARNHLYIKLLRPPFIKGLPCFMAPVVIDLNSADDKRDIVHRAVQALAEGKLVVFPTETVYGVAASALSEEAVSRLMEIKGRQPGHALTLAIKSADDALDFVPSLSPVAQRLARRCWPGPVTLVLDDDHPDSVVKRLPPAVREAISPEGTVGLRVPAHGVILSVLRLSVGPLALTSANRSGQPDTTTAQEAAEALGEDVELILDDGKSRYAQSSSVVRVTNDNIELLREGVLDEQTLRELSGFMVLFVCTGNTCRSPMAEMLMKRRMADKLNCKVEELEDRGFVVQSAGIAAMTGGLSSPEAVQVMSDQGLDLSSHQSQPLTDRLARYADIIFTMTAGHRDAIVAQWPDVAPRTKLICHDGSDVSDPIGGPPDLYRGCAEQIDSQLERWTDELDLGAD